MVQGSRDRFLGFRLKSSGVRVWDLGVQGLGCQDTWLRVLRIVAMFFGPINMQDDHRSLC